MLSAVPRTDYLWRVVGGVPPGDPTAHGVQEREGGWTVWIAGILKCLGYFSPGAPSVGAMDDDSRACRVRHTDANSPDILTTDKLHLSELSGGLAPMHLPSLEVSAKGLFAVFRSCPFPMVDRSTSPSAAIKSLVIPITRRFRVRPNKTVSLIQPIERELAGLATSLTIMSIEIIVIVPRGNPQRSSLVSRKRGFCRRLCHRPPRCWRMSLDRSL